VLEVNSAGPRVPCRFVAKVMGMPGGQDRSQGSWPEKTLADFNLKKRRLGHVGRQGIGVFRSPVSPASIPCSVPEDAIDRRGVMGDRPLVRGRFSPRASLAAATRVPPAGAPYSSRSARIDKTRIVDAVAAVVLAWLQGDGHLGHAALPWPTAGVADRKG